MAVVAVFTGTGGRGSRMDVSDSRSLDVRSATGGSYEHDPIDNPINQVDTGVQADDYRGYR